MVENIKKISEVEYEIERDQSRGMNTSVRIFATEQLLQNMKKDRTLDQAVNATT